MRAARYATYAMFFADGLWLWDFGRPIFPRSNISSSSSDSSLSVVLAVAAGSIVSMPLAGSGSATFWKQVLHRRQYCFLCVVPRLRALAPELILFVVAALLFGAAKGGVDVGINAHCGG